MTKTVKTKQKKAAWKAAVPWIVVAIVVCVIMGRDVVQNQKTKMVAQKYSEAVRIMPALSSTTGVRLNADEQHDGNILLGFIGCYGVVLEDGSVMLAECDLRNIRYDENGMPYDMDWMPVQSESYLIIHPDVPERWRGAAITLIPNQENDETWFYVAVGMESADYGYSAMSWYWSPEAEEYVQVTVEVDLDELLGDISMGDFV